MYFPLFFSQQAAVVAGRLAPSEHDCIATGCQQHYCAIVVTQHYIQ